MRSVNLIPPDEQRGDAASLRTGSLIYVLLAGLALLLLAIVVVALTGKQVSDRKTEKAGLEQELQQATARANSLAAFSNFRAVQEARAATVTSLAQSRFDWNRVLHELSLVLPEDITLTTLTGTVSPNVTVETAGEGDSGDGADLRSSAAGPALDISGCAPSQDAVAGFVSSLEDIDGVTRVGLSTSEAGADAGSSDQSDSAGSESAGCSAESQPFKFQIVVAFDAVPAPATATTVPSVPSSVPASSGGDQSQVADAQTQENVARASVREQTAKAQTAKSTLIPGG